MDIIREPGKQGHINPNITIDGFKTKKFFSISIFYKVSVYDTHIRIGCELHSRDKWLNFTDSEILSMDGKDALRFWKEHKKFILSI